MATDDIRLSDSERSVALQALGTHFAEGRIDMTEFNERTEKAATARTFSELKELFEDLPGGVPFTVGATGLQAQLPAATPLADIAPDVAELNDLKARGRKIQVLDLVFTAVGLTVFFVGMALDWSYFWVAMLAAGAGMVGSRALLRFDEHEEKAFESLEKAETKAKQQRLIDAEKRLRELEG
ncbi:DUF1707 domain-containing protein [Corynebacterium sp. H127]|uniref:DUF1707 SHOCT-like domain-containing protein n=1 Tax=Corynebacterium sp. H127 TaxID=3133418 RepID=UPI00309AA32F